MAGDTSRYRHLASGNGHALALEVAGPTIGSCLARAVEGFSAAFADVHPSIAGRRRRIVLRAATPSGLLRALLEEAMRLGARGELAIGLHAAQVDGETMHGDIETVPLDAAHVVSEVPSVLSWHDLRLEPAGAEAEAGTEWVGRVVAGM